MGLEIFFVKKRDIQQIFLFITSFVLLFLNFNDIFKEKHLYTEETKCICLRIKIKYPDNQFVTVDLLYLVETLIKQI